MALDFASPGEAMDFAARLDPQRCRVKVGLELFCAGGPAIVRSLHERGFEIFLDLKFNDIPNTVARACRVAAELDVWMLTVHTLGGVDMLRQAVAGLADHPRRPLLVGVTVLTSQDGPDLAKLGFGGDVAAQVERLAGLGRDAGLDGVVCSAHEAARIRDRYGSDLLRITPGVRPQGSGSDDQRRPTTPRAALDSGADYLVIGRPITRAEQPLDALAGIYREIGED